MKYWLKLVVNKYSFINNKVRHTRSYLANFILQLLPFLAFR